MEQYWNESVTEESWQLLHELAAAHKFVLIGGWAAYLHTKTQKSKDIDIVVDFGQLRALDAEFGLAKNERLRKYEIKRGMVDVDIYVPKFSKLGYPPEEILKKHDVLEGIGVASINQLLLLKLGAYEDRKGTVKGQKDAIDIVALLYHAKFDGKKFEAEAKIAGTREAMLRLKEIVREFADENLKYAGIGFVEFKRWRREFVAQ